jgi:hypothetical protein
MENKRVRLIRMEDPYTNLKMGDEGTIEGEDSMGQILVKWDNGSTLSLIPEIDEYQIIENKVFKYFEFVNTPNMDFISGKMSEIEDLVSSSGDVNFSWNFGSEDSGGSNMKIQITIPRENCTINWDIDFDGGELTEVTDHGGDIDDYDMKFSDPDEALGIVEKEIYYWLGINESIKKNKMKNLKKFKDYSLNESVFGWVRDKLNNHEDIGVEIMNGIKSKKIEKLDFIGDRDPQKIKFEIGEHNFRIDRWEMSGGSLGASGGPSYNVYLDDVYLRISNHLRKKIWKGLKDMLDQEDEVNNPVKSFRNYSGLDRHRK